MATTEPLYCDVCGVRIIRRKGSYREQWQPDGSSFARHYDCEPYTVKLLLVRKDHAQS